MEEVEPGVNDAGSPPEGVVSEDVTPAASSTAEPGVTADSPPAGRTLENVVAEMHRRDSERQKQLDSVLAWIGSQGAVRQAPPQAAPQPSQEPSNDDLWALAQNGDRQAFEALQRRIARQEVAQQYGQQSRATLVSSQLNALVTKYAALRDTSHPLTQTAQQAYALLLQAGHPAGAETLLEATLTAIADRPDLIVELYNQAPQAREQTRQSATTRAQAGVTGSTVRQTPTQAPQARISTDEAKLASRMGTKDPKGAKERFLKRQESGQSNLGAVGGFPSVIKEMEGM